MHREYIKWFSPNLGREMEILAFGHAGTPILAFPSSLGRFFEWEDFGMVRALTHQLTNGLNRLYCVDSVDAESLYNRGVDPYVRIKRHQQYEQYIFNEAIPFVQNNSGHRFIIGTGASFGAYHAANMLLKRPWDFGKLIALSGVFNVKSRFDGFYNEDVYFSNPTDYIPNMNDPGTLDAIRKNHIILSTAEYDPCKDDNYHMSYLLNQKGIPHTLDVQPGVFGHDWPYWAELVKKHVG